MSLIQTIYCNSSIDDTKTSHKCNAGMRIQDNGFVYAMNLREQISTNAWKKLSTEMYDGKILPLGEYCLIQDGNYSYNNTVGTKHTVMKLKVVESQIPNPEYEKWKAEQDAKKIETNTENK